LGLVEQVRTIMPNIAITTDIIVGFPTETEDEFQDTLDVVKQVRFDFAFTFKYSARPNTLASKKFPDDVSEEDKKSRIMRLTDVQRHISHEKNLAQIGQIQTILIEQESSKKSTDDFKGRNEGNIIVIVPAGPYKQGDYIQVKITDATSSVLKGTPL
jgi:tRNA-2-methylthio-N6-dimethylallyladenosine synthase